MALKLKFYYSGNQARASLTYDNKPRRLTAMPSFLPVLTFHDIDDRPSVISVSPRVFNHGMAKLHANGYRSLSQMEVVDILKRGALFPDRSFGITFDDGYRSVYTKAFSVLQHYGMSATVFLTAGQGSKARPSNRLPSLNGRLMLNWEEIHEMQRWGVEFGAHTCTHPDLTRIPPHLLKTEVCDAKALIEDALGVPVSCFAYPFGRYNHQVRHIVQENFSCASSDKLGLINKHSDLYALERVDAYFLRTHRLFQIMLSRLFPWYVLARSIPRHIWRTLQQRSGRR
jgi:peptidoglycan/xylan/chitin deacetylase (PgdA/CDA1 family)